MSPLITVIIPTYNRANYLKQAIDSLLIQQGQKLQIIVVDDGSTDHTSEIVKNFDVPNVLYKYQHNQGGGAARNNGLKYAAGKYIVFLDSDDYFLPDRFIKQRTLLDNNPHIDVVGSGHLFVNQHNKILNKIHPWESFPQLNLETILQSCPFTLPSAMIRKEVLEAVGGFDESLKIHQDTELWTRIALEGYKFAWTKEIKFAYRQHDANKGLTNGVTSRAANLYILEKAFNHKKMPPTLYQQKNKYLAWGHIKSAWREYSAEQIEEAKDDISKAVLLDTELLQDVDSLLDLILKWAGEPRSGGRIKYTQTVLKNLPSHLPVTRSHKRKALGRQAIKLLFESYPTQKSEVQQALKLLAKNDPTWFTNKGVLSITYKTLMPPIFHPSP
ncbi:MAG: glycosyltransferase family 2 protein [Anaerolineales bacterium]|nr:glycosyltransferase family 2 protein [Anaerolineales bacterium]